MSYEEEDTLFNYYSIILTYTFHNHTPDKWSSGPRHMASLACVVMLGLWFRVYVQV